MIIAMKKARIVVLKDDQKKLLKSLQKHQVIMPINFDKQNQLTNPDIQRTEDSLKLLKKYEGKKKFFVDANIVSSEDFEVINPEHQKLVDEIEHTHEEIYRLQAEAEALDDEIEVLKPFQDLEINLLERNNLKLARILTGYIPNRNLIALEEIVRETGGILNSYGISSSVTAVMMACYFEDITNVLEGARALGFTEYELPVFDGLVKEIIDEKHQAKLAMLKQVDDLNENLEAIAKETDKLRLLSDQLQTKNELDSVLPHETIQTMYLEGWVPENRVEVLKKAIEDAVEVFDLEVVDPDEGETPPTALKNKKFVEPFESITEMFSHPTHEEGIDPNGVMAPWYWIIFGMMMGDVGYGLVMLLLFGFLIKAKRPKGNALRMMKVFMYSGITTIIWGVLFGSYFGFEFYPLIFVPMNDPLSMLILSIVIGTLHILTGVIARTYYKFKSKQYLSAIADDLSWTLIFIGGILAVVGMLPDIGIPEIVIKIVGSIGLGILLIGLSLILFLGGHSKSSIFGKIIGGAGGLTGVVSYASDILSYARILALSLSTAVISMVMNMLAEMLQAGIIGLVLSFAVYIVGHVFNIAMGLLSAYVHAGRLQYIEFYGKFYGGGGYLFKPLSPKLKYIDEIK